MSDNNQSVVNKFKIDIDCGEALKGLKAIQREARKATNVLKDLQQVNDSSGDAE